MTETLIVTKVTTAKDGTKTYWYNGREPKPRKPRRPYRMDPQKQRLYAAEREAFLGPADGQTPRHIVVDLPELSDVKAYVRKVTRDKWFRRQYPFLYAGITVSDGRGLSAAVARGGHEHIQVKRAGRARWVVLHEIAHCVTRGHVQSHGPEYVRNYLALVRHFLGREAWRALRSSCAKHKVKMQTRRRRAPRPITPEQRAVLVERLALARAARSRASAATSGES